jgi:hypothetical protein
MIAKQKASSCPFQMPDNKPKRLRLFLWGDSRVGKTWPALHFPKVEGAESEAVSE